MSRYDIVLDIETTSLEADAAVVAVAAVVVEDLTEIVDHSLWRLDPTWSPGQRDIGTYTWWMSQPADVRDRMFGGRDLPWRFAEEFSEFVASYIRYGEPVREGEERGRMTTRMWGYPAIFDIGRLRALYSAIRHEFPMPYYQERDLMTIKWVARELHPEIDDLLRAISAENKSEHDAEADAIEQAKILIECASHLGLNRRSGPRGAPTPAL